DPRIAGIVLVNPWVQTEAQHARAQLKEHYLCRCLDVAWLRRILRGEFDANGTLRAMRQMLTGMARRGSPRRAGEPGSDGPLAERMAIGLECYSGPVLLLGSGRDLIAEAFDRAAQRSPRWRRLLRDQRVTRHILPAADHNFSRAEWRDQIV